MPHFILFVIIMDMIQQVQLTYPNVTPTLYEKAKEAAIEKGILY